MTSPSNGKGTVLIVEDSPENIDVLIKLLKGYDILVATDGREALETLEDEDFDLILLDVVMPGMRQKALPGHGSCR